MSPQCTEALLVMAEKWSERGVADTIHESLVNERLEDSEEHAAMLELRDEEQDGDCDLLMSASTTPELSTPSPIGLKPNEVESPPHTL